MTTKLVGPKKKIDQKILCFIKLSVDTILFVIMKLPMRKLKLFLRMKPPKSKDSFSISESNSSFGKSFCVWLQWTKNIQESN